MIGRLLGLLSSTAVSTTVRDSGRPEEVIRDRRGDACRPGSLLDHGEYAALLDPILGQPLRLPIERGLLVLGDPGGLEALVEVAFQDGNI